MKKRFFSLLSAILVMVSLATAACASDNTPRASDYFSATGVLAHAIGNGKVLIEVDINATHPMQEVGASDIYIYEQQSNGKYEIVHHYVKENYPNIMLDYNSCFASVDIIHQGTPGTKYYALVGCYAKDSLGSETLYFDTNIVTA